MSGQDLTGKAVSAGYATYREAAVTTTASATAVSFTVRTSSGDVTESELPAGRYISAYVTAKPDTVDANVTVQTRAHRDADWIDIAASAPFTAGTEAVVYEGFVRGTHLRVLVQSTGANDAADIAVCLK
jgi:hypothetical protein